MLNNHHFPPEQFSAPGKFLFLTPPYSLPGEMEGDQAPPLGTILCAHATRSGDAIINIVSALNRWPWVVPCIPSMTHSSDVSSALEQIPIGAGRTAFARSSDIGDILVAVRNRAPPTGQLMAIYLRLRCGPVIDPIGDQFIAALDEPGRPPPHSVSWYSRKLRDIGPLTAHDWRSVAGLAKHLHCVGGSSFVFSDAKKLERRTAERHTRRYLGTSLARAARIAGWEWIIEYVVRRNLRRYTGTPKSLPEGRHSTG